MLEVTDIQFFLEQASACNQPRPYSPRSLTIPAFRIRNIRFSVLRNESAEEPDAKAWVEDTFGRPFARLHQGHMPAFCKLRTGQRGGRCVVIRIFVEDFQVILNSAFGPVRR